MTKIRKLSVDRELTGFWDGVSRGMASTNDAFDGYSLRIRGGNSLGLRLDAEAIRSDVGRATAKITREIAKSIRSSKAG